VPQTVPNRARGTKQYGTAQAPSAEGRTICQEGIRQVVIIISLIPRAIAGPSAMAAPCPAASAPLAQGHQPQLPAMLGRVLHLRRAIAGG
jgi:hypothetical protein